MARYSSESSSPSVLRATFTTKTAEECLQILSRCLDARRQQGRVARIQSSRGGSPPNHFTFLVIMRSSFAIVGEIKLSFFHYFSSVSNVKKEPRKYYTFPTRLTLTSSSNIETPEKNEKN